MNSIQIQIGVKFNSTGLEKIINYYRKLSEKAFHIHQVILLKNLIRKNKQ